MVRWVGRCLSRVPRSSGGVCTQPSPKLIGTDKRQRANRSKAVSIGIAKRVAERLFRRGAPNTGKAGEPVNLTERMRVEAELRRRHAMFGDQKGLLDGLYQASQQLWSDDEMRSRCDQLMRDLSRAMVKNAQQIWDLSSRELELGKVAEGEESGAKEETLPW